MVADYNGLDDRRWHGQHQLLDIWSLMDVRHVIREALGRSRLGKLALDLSSDMVGKWQLETMHKGLDLLI